MNSPVPERSAMPPGCAVGVDVGGTKIAAGVVTFPDARVHLRREIPTHPQRSGEAILIDVERLVAELKSCAQADGLQPSAAGLGLCEIVRTDGTIASANAVDWQELPVRQRLGRILPTTIEADVRAAARAEAMFGAGRDARILLYVTIGTGIASCLAVDGEPFTGARGGAGTLASGPMPGLAAKNDSSLPGLESFASGPALVVRYNVLGRAAISGREVLEAARDGDVRAVEVVQSAGASMGAVIGSMVNVLDPELVVLGGGLGLAEGLYRSALDSAMRRHIWWPEHRGLPLIPAALGVDAGIIGAALAAVGCQTAARSRTS